MNSQIDKSKEVSDKNTLQNKEDTEVAGNSSADGKIDKLLMKDVDIGGREVSDILLSYGNDEFVVNSLNREYSKLGFSFEYASVESRRGTNVFGLPAGVDDNDTIVVSHKNDPSKRYYIKFDTWSSNEEYTKMLIGIMKSMHNNNYDAANKFYEGKL